MKWARGVVIAGAAVPVAVLVAGGAGCAHECGSACHAGRESGPGITHVVLVTLHDQSERGALERETRQMLERAAGVDEFAVGPPVETGRAVVDGSYDVGFTARFKDRSGYAAYESDPGHTALREGWRSRVKQLRIFDFGAADLVATDGRGH